MRLFNRKKRISRDNFIEGLYLLLSNRVTEVWVNKLAKSLEFEISKEEDYNKLFDELFLFNMWLIVFTCEQAFDNQEKSTEILDGFHHLVYERHYEGSEIGYKDWLVSMGMLYKNYYDALEKKTKPGPHWWVARVFNERLFGEVKRDPFIQTTIGEYLQSVVDHNRNIIKKFAI
jgi:hypothetical protein